MFTFALDESQNLTIPANLWDHLASLPLHKLSMEQCVFTCNVLKKCFSTHRSELYLQHEILLSSYWKCYTGPENG